MLPCYRWTAQFAACTMYIVTSHTGDNSVRILNPLRVPFSRVAGPTTTLHVEPKISTWKSVEKLRVKICFEPNFGVVVGLAPVNIEHFERRRCCIHGTEEVITMAPAASGAAEARKRRKEIIQSQRGEPEAAAEPKTEEPKVAAAKPEKKPPKKRKFDEAKTMDAESVDSQKKTQIRYDPDVPMDKEQLAAWRREARRVRNRESAAASRQRIRNRINELEDEVGQWKAKYSQAMERLAALQQSVEADEESTDKN